MILVFVRRSDRFRVTGVAVIAMEIRHYKTDCTSVAKLVNAAHGFRHSIPSIR